MRKALICVVVSGAQPQLGIREVELSVGALRLLDERVGLVEIEKEALDDILAKLYECVLLQEAILTKAWCTDPPTEPRFYAELAASADWSELAGSSFAVSVRKLGGYPQVSAVDLAAAVADGILRRCGNASVDLEEPKIRVRLVASRKAAIVGVLLLRRRGDRFRFRSKRYKPFKHPASLTPEDAKLLVNLSACRRVLLDPFCGSGSIVIEACLSGLEAVGLDVDRKAARGARDNLAAFSCDARGHVVVGDACMLPFRDCAFDAIATNPPYGRSAQLRSASGRSADECLTKEGFRVLKGEGRIAYVIPLSPRSGCDTAEGHVVRVHGGLARAFAVKAKEGAAHATGISRNGFVDAH